MKRFLIVLSLLILGTCYITGQEMTAIEVSGRVEFQISGREWQPVQRGMSIPVSATISTGFQSRAVLESSRSTIVVQPLTRLTIEQIQDLGQSSQTSLSLRTGRISAVVKKNDDEPAFFQVKSPIATAAVRGTEFTFNGFQLTVEAGLVAFSSDGGRVVTVPLGASSEMSADGVPQEVLDAVLAAVSVDPGVQVIDLIIPLLEDLGIIDITPQDLVVTIQ